MKKLLIFLLLSISALTFSQVRNEIQIPDILGFKTLKCDFHMHTVFSDGLVWPTVRVGEAYAQGLDVIAITDHIEYRPHKNDMPGASLNRPYEIAEAAARSNNIILIRGSEITRSMPPGHSNALFLTDCNALDVPAYMDAFKAARAQNAFIFWNHPGWDAQQPDTTRWFKEHTELYDAGLMQGIEVVNGPEYYPEAQRWCMEKKLTMLGNSDVHEPFTLKEGEHRTMTLVFASARTPEAIHEALTDRRTVVYLSDKLIGEEKFLKEIFHQSLEILNTEKTEKNFRITVKNKSDLPFYLHKTSHNPDLVYFRDYTIEPHGTHTITVRFVNGVAGGDVNFEITNLLAEPNKGLQVSIPIRAGADI